jgi:hypothetical protein
MKTTVILFFVAVSAATLAQAPASAKPDWSNFEFLLGSWTADTDVAQPGVTGSSVFRLDLDRAILVRENKADYPPQNGRPAMHHHDLMVIADDGSGALKARYWDNEPHMIDYNVTANAGEVSFLAGADAKGPRYRLIYKRVSDNSVSGRFDIAPPGGDFTTYRQWTMRRTAAH